MLEIKRATLPNGLKIVYSHDSSTQMVAINVLYKVGSRDEDPAHTGFAHLFEHLMFGPSINIPSYDTPLQESGGENNAWTNNDITNYYLTIPKQHAELGFWLESDRMLQLAFSPESLEVQRNVVMEEFKQRCLNQPYGDIGHLLRGLSYVKHPYQWPTIGKELKHIEEVTMEQVKSFYDSFYQPSNAILSVTGQISWEETIRLAEKWFSSIPNHPIIRRNYGIEPEYTEQRRLEVTRDVPFDALYMTFLMSDRFDKQYYAADMLSDVLANGSSSRLSQRLVKKRHLFNQIDAHISGSLDKGLFQIDGRPADGVSLEDAEQAVWEELQLLQTELVSEREIKKLKNKFEATLIFGNINYQNLATNLAWHEMLGPGFGIEDERNAYMELTAETLRHTAKELFQPHRAAVLYYKSRNN